LLVTWGLDCAHRLDIDHQLLPDGITLPLLWAGLLAAVIVVQSRAARFPVSARDAIIGSVCGYVSLWLVFPYVPP